MHFCVHLSFLTLIAFVCIEKIKSQTFEIEVDAVLDQCCAIGSKHSSASKFCSNYHFSMSHEIPSNLHALCRSNIKLCCEKNLQFSNCQAGKKWAKFQPNCGDKKQSEMFKVCCNACKVGQQIARAGGKCDRSSWDVLVSPVLNECCNEQERDYSLETNEVDIDDDALYEATEDDYSSLESCDEDHDCQHKCYVRSNESFCSCDEGYKLSSDGYSCTPKAPAGELRFDDCDQGFKKNSIGYCEDINECQQNVCNEFETCINTNGSYLCNLLNVCPSGYEFKRGSKKCEDIDECYYENPCLRTENCVNNEGSFSCTPKTCPSGYDLNQRTGDCDDIDECLNNPCKQKMKCINFPGAYSCECENGLRKDLSHPLLCRDIDECEEHPALCDQKCFNTWGGYKCSCNRGYIMNQDKRTCSDIDECEKNGKFLCPGTCKNTEGSYRCGCPKGTQLINGRNCIDINECKGKENVCGRRNDFCLNLIGSFKCVERNCDRGYRYSRGSCRLMDRTLCYKNNNEVDGKCNVPIVYIFAIGAITANCTVFDGGRNYYNFKMETEKDFDVELKDFKIVDAGQNVLRANKDFFRFEKSRGNLVVKLMKSIDGPQEIKLDIWIHLRSADRMDDTIQGLKIFVIVSPNQLL